MSQHLETFAYTANVVAPIFFIVFLGFLLKRTRIIDDAFVATASKLVFVVTLPALVFMSISRTNFHAVFNPQMLSYITIATLIVVALISWQAQRLIQRPEDVGVFIQGAFRGNYGIVGLAVSLNIYGDEGLAKASLILALIIPLYNSLSIIALTLPMKQQNNLSAAKVGVEILKNPLIIAVLLALPFSYFGFTLPAVINRTGDYFADITLPLALMAVGASLNLKSLKHTSSMAFWATATKLVLIPFVLTCVAALLGFADQDVVLMFVLFGTPTAAASFIMAKAMGGNAELAANIILTTTLGSIVSLGAGIFILKMLQFL
ncbi:AEC family transporter [Neptunomonas marina]|uniref:AEC family transporter n=1 Tax=Neptunomonas marina TaxID=1815562 RepID=A0A437Q654_9GAMM|nr:AEC family transporter [Neptunomonas marina]RVU29981.1 AEC family transporter [Neptunomonas marina]